MKKRIVILLGLSLILLGILANPWALSKYVAAEIVLSQSLKIAIASAEFFLIVLGTLLIYYRERFKLWGNIVLFLFTFSSGIIFAEFLTRFIDPSRMMKIYRENPHRTGSYRVLPNLNLILRGTKIKTNSLGMRWWEISKEKPAGIKRIAFLGDSYTFGCWADRIENSFVGVFDRLLAENYEVLNFGVPGYGFMDMELYLKDEILSFSPDVLILTTYVGNDFLENCDGTSVIQVEGSTLKKRSLKRLNINQLFLKSSLYQLGIRVVKKFTERRLDEFSPYTTWSKKKYTSEQTDCMQKAFQTLERMNGICARHNIQFILSAIPTMQQVNDTHSFKGDYNIELPQKYIRDFSMNHSIPYLDLAPILMDAPKERKPLFVRDGHLHNNGHEVIGKALADFFLENRGK